MVEESNSFEGGSSTCKTRFYTVNCTHVDEFYTEVISVYFLYSNQSRRFPCVSNVKKKIHIFILRKVVVWGKGTREMCVLGFICGIKDFLNHRVWKTDSRECSQRVNETSVKLPLDLRSCAPFYLWVCLTKIPCLEIWREAKIPNSTTFLQWMRDLSIIRDITLYRLWKI